MFFHSDSSFIEFVKYDKKNKLLQIKMNGKNYDFCNVPFDLYLEFEAAESHGIFYNSKIKNKYDCPKKM